MSIEEEKARIIDFIHERHNQIDIDLQAAVAEREKALQDLEAAGTHDLRENAARATAQVSLAQATRRIGELTERKNVGVDYVDSYRRSGFCSVGSALRLENTDNGQTWTIVLVPVGSGASVNGAVAEDSPVGQAVLGKVEGDHVVVRTGSRTLNYRILEVL